MRITKWGEYGVLCCLELAQAELGTPIGAAEIAPSRGIPLQYAQQILQRLRRGALIVSIRGPGGGYRLARPAEQISLREILMIAEGATFNPPCVADDIFPDCSQRENSCALKTVWSDLQNSINALLEERSLASILALKTGNDLVEIKRAQG